MSWEATTWVVKNSKHTGSPYFLLLIIANHCHSDGTGAFPSIDTLAKECRMSPRNVVRIIEKLEKSKELKVEKNRGEHFTNLYSLPLMEGCQDVRGDIMGPILAQNGTQDVTQKKEIIKEVRKEEKPTTTKGKNSKIKNRREGKRRYSDKELDEDQNIVLWMEAILRKLGKPVHHMHPPGIFHKNNHGPTRHHVETIMEDEKSFTSREIRSCWLDFVNSKDFDVYTYPYSVFMEKAWPARVKEIAEEIQSEKKAKFQEEMRQLEETPGLPPGMEDSVVRRGSG